MEAAFHTMRSDAPARLATALAASLSTVPTPPPPAAFAQDVSDLLYGSPQPSVQNFQQQISDAISIKTMRGVWTLRETFSSSLSTSSSPVTGSVTFRGALTEGKGTCTYEGGGPSGRGPWIIKSDGFGRLPTGKGGMIEQKALWKLRRGSEGTFQYSGRVRVVGYAVDGFPDASIEGDLIQLINGGKPKGGSERKVGTFYAKLERPLNPEEEQAATDSAAAGGRPEALQLNAVGETDAMATVQSEAQGALYGTR